MKEIDREREEQSSETERFMTGKTTHSSIGVNNVS